MSDPSIESTRPPQSSNASFVKLRAIQNMTHLQLAELLAPERLALLDRDAVEAVNRCKREPYRLHPELGPSAYEGDIDAAKVVLLLANPGYDDTSTLIDHSFVREGWPLSGLHPEAPKGLRDWWYLRLRHLIERVGPQAVSKRVACLQVCPWASGKFDDALTLPSLAVTLDAATRCANRGSVLLVMRAEKCWLRSEAVRNSHNRHRVNSWRSSYVSPGNLSASGWNSTLIALGAN